METNVGNLVFISGDFCSGSTLLFTLFRETGEYYCLYEPLHEKLLENLLWPLRVYDHHFFVENYFSEYKGFRKIPSLFDPEWGLTNFHLSPEADAGDLYRYLSYLIETAIKRRRKAVLKFNRATFRLGWLRAKFPQARIVHIHRPKEEQWASMVKRVQTHLEKEDVGQREVTFQGFNIARWCEDLKRRFPELDAKNSETGYERFCKLYELSRAEHLRYADVSVDYWELTHEFEKTCKRIWECVGCNCDLVSLKQFVIPPEKQKPLPIQQSGSGVHNVIDRAGRKYARARVVVQTFLHETIGMVKDRVGTRTQGEETREFKSGSSGVPDRRSW